MIYLQSRLLFLGGEVMWIVRVEITGDFVSVEHFDNEQDAREYEARRILEGIWDNIDCWEEGCTCIV